MRHYACVYTYWQDSTVDGISYKTSLKPGTKDALWTPLPHFSFIEMGNDHHQIFSYPKCFCK